MKRSVNFNGFQPSHRRISAADLINTLRTLGYTDAEIVATLQQMQQGPISRTDSVTTEPTEAPK